MPVLYLPVVVERRGKKHVARHEWYCSDCQGLVHAEPLLALTESEIQESNRTKRIKAATEEHVCND